MSLRHFARCATSLLLVVSAFTSSTSAQEVDLEERPYTARPEKNIFSPLDLPAPNSMRLGSGAPGPDYWQQQVDYEIQVSIDPEERLVHGKAHITYHNASPHALDYLWLSLEQNAFREDSIAAAVGAATAIGMKETEGDGYTIHGLTHEGEDLTYSVYDTLARVPLSEPIAADGGSFEFDIEWSFLIPKNVFRRFGIREFDAGKVYQLAQWFPAVAVYDDVNGWNTLPYIGTGEFYTNFGTYDVEITAPRSMVVVATGVLQNEEDVYTEAQFKRMQQAKATQETVAVVTRDEVGTADARPSGEGPLTWRFHADDVRTFAWACSDAFLLDATSTVDGTLVQTAYPEEGLPVWGEATQMLRVAIEGYNRRLIPYPYPVATNVLGAEGGMEYPMILFCRGRRESGVYGVTTHEIGHSWFPMMINTDERRHAWMDEGFNTFINGYSTPDWFGPRDRNENDPGNFARSMMAPDMMPIATPPDWLNGWELGTLQYAKTGVGLTLLRESILGPERFDYAFRVYMDRWKFKSPQPADFFRTMEDAAGADLAWFWRGWFYENITLDQAISGIAPPKRDMGPRIRIDNLGGLVMPISLHVVFEDGTEEYLTRPVEVWFQSNRIIVELVGRGPIAEATLDWDRRFPDVVRDNNRWNVAEKRQEKSE